MRGDAPNGFTLDDFDEPFYSLTLAEEPAGVTLSDRPGATQKYYGVDLSVVKRLSDHWMLRGNFGWNSFKQYLTPPRSRTRTTCGPGRPELRLGPPDRRAWQPGIRPKDSVFLNASWQFNVNALYQGPFGHRSRRQLLRPRRAIPNPYYVRTAGRRTPPESTTRYLIQINQLDTYRYDNVYELDLRLAKTFPIGGFSVTPGRRALQRGQRQHGPPALPEDRTTTGRRPEPSRRTTYFNQIIEVQSPRIVRLGIQVNF